MNYIDALNQRYSVKKFDKEKTVSSDKIHNILEAGKLSASSMGLQPYKIIVVESEEMKQQLIPAFHNPSQISTCSHLVILVAKKNVDERYIDGYFRHITEVREVPLGTLDVFRKNIETYTQSPVENEVASWAEKQTYIVLGNLIFAAALEQVDSCPMEGFKKELMEQILGLDSENESVAVTLALGYRAEDDAFQHLKKVRKPDEKLYKFI